MLKTGATGDQRHTGFGQIMLASGQGETALARLSDPDFAMGGPALRLLAKAQGVLSSYAWIWRR